MGSGVFGQLFNPPWVSLSLLGIVFYIVGARIVFRSGCRSSGRNWIGAGLVINSLTSIVVLLVRIVEALVMRPQYRRIFLYYRISQVLSVVAALMIVWGIVKLLNRASQLEGLLEDQDDDENDDR